LREQRSGPRGGTAADDAALHRAHAYQRAGARLAVRTQNAPGGYLSGGVFVPLIGEARARSRSGLGPRAARSEGQELVGVAGELAFGEAGDEVSQRRGLIDQDGVVGQEPSWQLYVEFGVAQHRPAEHAEGVSLQADAVSKPCVATGERDEAVDGPRPSAV